MKFQIGDRIRGKRIGVLATITGLSFNSIHQENDIYMVLDVLPSEEWCYMADTVKDLWEKVTDIKDAIDSGIPPLDSSLTPGQEFVPWFGYQPTGLNKKECEHQWVEVGFNFSKTVCKHCDMEKS